MTSLSTIYAQLAVVAQRDAEEMAGHMAWPPKDVSPEDMEEAERLFDTADALHARAVKLGHSGGWPF